jgi:prepilin-type N-terminal cleavage/methylation domain-containing protein
MFERRGFTLLEVMVTISIIAILASIIYMSFGEARENARNKALTVELKEVQLALETYRAQTGSFPLPAAPCQVTDAGELYATDNTCSTPYISNLVPEFISALPSSADSGNDNCNIEYRTDTTGSWFKLIAINCLSGVDATTGVGPNEPLARCSNVCDPVDRCDPTTPVYYQSVAVYSLGGQCE